MLLDGTGSARTVKQDRLQKCMDDIVIIGGPNGGGKMTAAPLLVRRSLNIREL